MEEHSIIKRFRADFAIVDRLANYDNADDEEKKRLLALAQEIRNNPLDSLTKDNDRQDTDAETTPDKCPRCGNTNIADTAKFCGICGYPTIYMTARRMGIICKVDPLYNPLTETLTTQEEPMDDEAAIKHVKDNLKIVEQLRNINNADEDEKKRLLAMAHDMINKPVECPQCKKPNKRGDDFCGDCGGKLLDIVEKVKQAYIKVKALQPQQDATANTIPDSITTPMDDEAQEQPPTVVDSKQKRTHQIFMKVNEEELQAIDEKARIYAMPLSAFCRMASLGIKPRTVIPAQTIKDISRWSANLNQLSAIKNSSGTIDMKKIEDLRQDAIRLMQIIKKGGE